MERKYSLLDVIWKRREAKDLGVPQELLRALEECTSVEQLKELLYSFDALDDRALDLFTQRLKKL